MLPSHKQKQKAPAAMLSAPSAPPSTSASSPAPPLFLHSPGAIPPRRSSTSQHQHQHQLFAGGSSSASTSASASVSSSSAARPRNAPAPAPAAASSSSSTAPGSPPAAPSVLRSVPESDWLGSAATRRPRKPSITMASLTGAGPAAAAAVAAAAAAAAAAAPANSSAETIKLDRAGATADGNGGGHPLPGRPKPRSPAPPTALQTDTASASPPPPPPDPQRYATADLNFGARQTWTEDKERIVCGPFDYLNGVRGKEFRTQLINAFNGWLEVPAASLAVITRVVGMLHTASLLVDDVEDSSSLRRGLPVAHNIFGVPQTINSANYIYFVALQELQTLRNPQALAVFAEELCNLHRGQGLDLFWRDTLTCPTEEDYLEMVGHKTGGLFRLGIKLMQAESRSLVDCVPLVNLLGLLFQIQDDYRNLLASEYSQNKGMCEDLTEGKFSFPVIHSIRSQPGNLQLLNILRQRTADEEVKRYAVAHMESTGSFAYTRQVIAVLAARARALADALDEGKGRSRAVHAILDRLAVD